MAEERMIEIKELSKKYSGLEVLRNINLSINNHGIVAVLGPNGSGKTTLLKSLLGMVIPQQGSMMLDGEPVLGQWQYRNKIAYLPQIASFPQNLRVAELIRMIKNLRPGNTREAALIDRFNLQPHLTKKLGTLSGGTRQKVNIVLALMFESPLIILDEPSTGLDPVALIALKELLAEEKAMGRMILFTTHIMNLVEEIADRVIFILEGNIWFDGTVNLLLEKTAQSSLEKAIAVLLKEAHV